MNHKTERITKDHKIATTLVVLAAVAVLLTSTAAIGTGHIALADNSKAGISLPTDTKQKQECQTVGGISPVTCSCTAVSTNAVTTLGGVLDEVTNNKKYNSTHILYPPIFFYH